MTTVIQVFTGVISTILLGLIVGPFVRYVKKYSLSHPPNDALKDKWDILTRDTEIPRASYWLGLLERLLFFGATWLQSYELIAGWLAFKVVSKWEVWSSIISIPDKLKDVDDIDYLIARHRWGSQRLTSFLIGTISNIIVAFAGMLIGRYGYQLLFCGSL